eukprot:jgi/Tetstr1/427736/TSEL_017860.t1
MTLRELKAHLSDLVWDKVNQKAFDIMTSAVWRSVPALKHSLDAGFHQLKYIAVLRQSHEDRLDELAAEKERCEDIVRRDEIRIAEAMTAAQASSSARPCTSTTPVAAVEAAEAEDEAVAKVVVEADEAMEVHLEADGDHDGTLDLEAMFSRILKKSQAAHGATGAMRLALEQGRLAELPPGSARNHELRMRQPGWDAQREQLTKQRPQGFQPAAEQEAHASYEARSGGGAITPPDMLDIRNQKLLQHMRTALQHAKFPGLPIAVVSDMTPEHAARWLEAPVQSVYGLSLPRVNVPPLSSSHAEPQASIHPVDVVQHGVQPLETRRRLSATSSELRQLRKAQRSAFPDHPEYDRHNVFYVDCKLTVIVIGGVRILMALLDTGCDYIGVHRRVVDRMKQGEVDATLQFMSMQDIGGKMELQRLVGRISCAINPDNDWERKFEWPSLAILEGDHLPDVVMCTSVMAHLGMVIDVGGMLPRIVPIHMTSAVK